MGREKDGGKERLKERKNGRKGKARRGGWRV